MHLNNVQQLLVREEVVPSAIRTFRLGVILARNQFVEPPLRIRSLHHRLTHETLLDLPPHEFQIDRARARQMLVVVLHQTVVTHHLRFLGIIPEPFLQSTALMGDLRVQSAFLGVAIRLHRRRTLDDHHLVHRAVTLDNPKSSRRTTTFEAFEVEQSLIDQHLLPKLQTPWQEDNVALLVPRIERTVPE